MNQVVLIGRLTKAPELKYTTEEKAVCNFTLAVDRPSGNEREKRADFIRIQAWGRLAENCAKYLSKGKQVAVAGSIRTGSYQNRNGDTVYTTEVSADRVEFLGGKKDAEENTEKPQPIQPVSDPEAVGGFTAGFEALDDDEIPF